MIVQHTDTGQPNSKTIERWSAYLKEVHVRTSHTASQGPRSANERIVTSLGC
jgi:hypothetical protein